MLGLSKLGKTLVTLDAHLETLGPGGHRRAGTKTTRNKATTLNHVFASKTDSVQHIHAGHLGQESVETLMKDRRGPAATTG